MDKRVVPAWSRMVQTCLSKDARPHQTEMDIHQPYLLNCPNESVTWPQIVQVKVVVICALIGTFSIDNSRLGVAEHHIGMLVEHLYASS